MKPTLNRCSVTVGVFFVGRNDGEGRLSESLAVETKSLETKAGIAGAVVFVFAAVELFGRDSLRRKA